MSVSELTNALQTCKIDVQGLNKPQLQSALINWLNTVNTVQVRPTASLSVLSPIHTPKGSSHHSSGGGNSPVDASNRKSTIDEAELQLRFRELELKMQWEREERVFEREMTRDREQREHREREQREQRESEREREQRDSERREREQREQRDSEREQRESEHQHELALKQLELGVLQASASIPVAAPRGNPPFGVDIAIKLIPKFTENDVESFLLTFEKIA